MHDLHAARVFVSSLSLCSLSVSVHARVPNSAKAKTNKVYHTSYYAKVKAQKALRAAHGLARTSARRERGLGLWLWATLAHVRRTYIYHRESAEAESKK